MATFHTRTGTGITLSNNGRTALRNQPSQEFNNGIVFSSNPLQPNQIFEIVIDKKVNTWSGSVEVGVISIDPAVIDLPSSAGQLRDGAWVMSGASIIRNGHTIVEDYGANLDLLSEGDRVGVMITSSGSLHIFVNGIDQGPAFDDVPARVFAVVDLYGKCSQISIVQTSLNPLYPSAISSIVSSGDSSLPVERLAFHERCGLLIRLTNGNRTAERRCPMDEFNNGIVMTNRPLHDNELFEIRIDRMVDKWSGSIEIGVTTHNPAFLEFPATMTNMRSGTIMMSSGGILTNGRGVRRAYASYNLDELREGGRIGLMRKSLGAVHFFINGVDQGAADIQASNTVWGVVDLYGMAVKVTLLDSPSETLHTFQPTLAANTNVVHNITSSGGRVSNNNSISANALSNLLSSLNSIDSRLGLTTSNTVESEVTSSSNNTNSRLSLPDNNVDSRLGSNTGRVESMERQIHRYLQMFRDLCVEAQIGENNQEPGALLFSSRCGCHASVINNNKTAHRPNATDDFNNAVVLTNRHLRPNELFEIRLDKVIDKWAGSVEIGVTTHSPLSLEFPSTMTNIRSGTWMMTGTGVMHNGVTVIDEYGCSLDTLKVGDRVGVMRKEDGTLHFYVNGTDQGPAASNVPSNIYGVIDLYGQAAQATIIDHSAQLTAVNQPVADDLIFHATYGHNVVLSNENHTASRPVTRTELTGCCVLSSRPLHDDEMFEIVLDTFHNSFVTNTLSAGVTLVDTERQLPDSSSSGAAGGRTVGGGHTWMLSGNTVRKDGHEVIMQSYGLNVDHLVSGSKLTIVRRASGALHFLLNGVDYGVAATNVPTGVHAIVDLCGQCGQVTIGPASGRTVVSLQTDNQLTPSSHSLLQISSLPHHSQSESSSHVFSSYCGKNIAFKNDNLTACRVHGHDHAIVFASRPLCCEELFEIKVDSMSSLFTGSIRIGLTTLPVSEMSQSSLSVNKATELTSYSTWLLIDDCLYKNGQIIRHHCIPSLERLTVGSCVGLRATSNGNMHFIVDGHDYGSVADGVPNGVYPIVDLSGKIDQVTVVSSCDTIRPAENRHALITLPSAELSNENLRWDDLTDDALSSSQFHSVHGRHIELSGDQCVARRVVGYNEAFVISRQPLVKNKVSRFRLDEIDHHWECSLKLGITSTSADRQPAAAYTAFDLLNCWIIQGSSVFQNLNKIRDNLPVNLDSLAAGDVVGLLLDGEGSLHISVNGVDKGIIVSGLSSQHWYAVVDLYGRCKQVSQIWTQDKPVLSPVAALLKKSSDSDSGLKEKINRSIQMEPQRLRRNCRNLALCTRARAMLGLPDGYFSLEAMKCYCELCLKPSADGSLINAVSQGEPARDFALPLGWTKFSLRLQAKSESLSKKWHIAYHGAPAKFIRRILDTGQLNTSDDGNGLRPLQTIGYDEKAEVDGADKCDEHKMVLLSPIINCVVNDATSTFEFIDPVSHKPCSASVAMQVCVKPGSYKTKPLSKPDCLKEKIDARFNKNELEWWTKESGAIVVNALIVRVQ